MRKPDEQETTIGNRGGGGEQNLYLLINKFNQNSIWEYGISKNEGIEI